MNDERLGLRSASVRRTLFSAQLVSLLLVVAACTRTDPDTGDGVAAPPNDRTDPPKTVIFPFDDVTSSSGLEMTMRSGGTPTRQILEVNGGGIGVIDVANNGRPDIFVANGAQLDDPEHGPGSRLFRNDGQMRFTDVTKEANIEHTRWSFGVAVGDADGDGYDDILICCYGPNVLLRNLGDGTFQDVSAEAGVADARWATSAAFGDLDLNGTLDLYVVNYLDFDHLNLPPRARYKGVTVMGGPHGLPPAHDVLYRNNGYGVFEDVTVAAGCRPPHAAYGLGAVIIDTDQNGYPEIFVGNDSMGNFSFRRTGAWTYRDDGVRSGIASNFDGNDQATMGIGIGDVTGNGYPDFFTTNFSSDTNTLHINRGDGFFDDRTRSWGLGQISHAYLGWACAFVDLDHDGAEDLVSFNGHVYPEATIESMDAAYEQLPLVFRRQGDRFEPVSSEDPRSWLRRPGRDRTAVFVDLDGDGAVDMVVAEINGPIRVLHNQHSGRAGDHLVVALRDTRSPGNHRAIGAVITLTTKAGPAHLVGAVRQAEGREANGYRQRRWIFSGGFQASPAKEVHFGIPDHAQIATLEVRWPDGEVTVRELTAEEFGRRLIITR